MALGPRVWVNIEVSIESGRDPFECKNGVASDTKMVTPLIQNGVASPPLNTEMDYERVHGPRTPDVG